MEAFGWRSTRSDNSKHRLGCVYPLSSTTNTLHTLIKKKISITCILKHAIVLCDFFDGYRPHVGIVEVEPARAILTAYRGCVVTAGSETSMVIYDTV